LVISLIIWKCCIGYSSNFKVNILKKSAECNGNVEKKVFSHGIAYTMLYNFLDLWNNLFEYLG
jgi:hypothetical protein